MVELKKITYDNFNECIKLVTTEEQKEFVASNIYSLAEAYVALTNQECIPMPYAIYNDDIMVGFLMMSYNEKDEDDDEDEDAYSIWRFMIDKKYQGKGYGKESMAKALQLIKTFPHGEAKLVVLSYEPENVVAKKLYASFEFEETGEIEYGEAVAILKL